jgi:DNA-directed RNA polymerase subunit beta'
MVRSAFTCAMRHGLCVRCYGLDLGRNQLVKIGEAAGIIAAQSIGEPGTQLTLRTFHTGGVAGASDITQGLPRVQELFEARAPKGQAVIADLDGTATVRESGDQQWVRVTNSELKRVNHHVPGNYAVKVHDGDEVQEGDLLASRKGQDDVLAKTKGRAVTVDGGIDVVWEETSEREYEIPITARLRVEQGDQIRAGDMITEGSKNPHELMAVMGAEAVRDYLLAEIQEVYRSQGVTINDKHIEVIIRQMLRRLRITESGDSALLPGELVDHLVLEEVNQGILAQGGEPALAEPVVMGITKAALNTDSFLSAASFQHTISVLANAAVEGRMDDLRGLKESVLIGKLIPAGTGFGVQQGAEGEEEVGPASEAAALAPFEVDISFDDSLFRNVEGDMDRLDAAFRARSRSTGPAPSLPQPSLSDYADDADEL